MRPRLLSPLLMSEFNKMISIRNNNNNQTLDPMETQRRRLMRVKKDLFGPVNHEDARVFVERELMAMSENSCAKWNFDFVNEKPLDTPNPRYIWEKVSSGDSIPESYSLRRFPYLSKNSVLLENERICNNNNIVMKEDDLKPLDRLSQTKEESFNLKMERQTQITDYMKYSRKRRTSATASKMAELSHDDLEPRARKRSRSLTTTTIA